MPPKKRKSPAAKKVPVKTKKSKAADEEQSKEAADTDQPESKDDLKTAVESLKKANKEKKKCYVVDSFFQHHSAAQLRTKAVFKVFEDYDCMLNQTNISHNNNKYYVIQVIQAGSDYCVWTRWGRVGEPGANQSARFDLPDQAVKAFEKKFKDKTRNNWEDRKDFVPVKGKYTLIEVDQSEDTETADKMTEVDSKPPSGIAPCKLDTVTQQLMKLIFDNDMFKEQMAKFELDVKKMPLGKLSKPQLAKGFDALDDIEAAINKKASGSKLAELSSKFYTLIPHSFGRKLPPTMDQAETVKTKREMLLVLGDIVIAQDIKKEQEEALTHSQDDLAPNPIDVNYDLLKCELEHVDDKSKEYKILNTYVNNTKSTYSTNLKLQTIWKVSRGGEDKRFAEHDKITNRRLLWHGTNIAVVAAILKTGLRIMPHAGGRVGSGIYFASEHSKSASYVQSTNGNIGIMFLNEVALGKEHHIDTDDWTLEKAPPGFDSIIAKGCTEPDAKLDTHIMLDGKKVIVPQGKPLQQPKYSHSRFSQSEYLVYKESQNRIRYLLQFKFR